MKSGKINYVNIGIFVKILIDKNGDAKQMQKPTFHTSNYQNNKDLSKF